MSTLFSNKFLRFRAPTSSARVIEQDEYCVSCGYNVRGLTYGRNCPECGRAILKSTEGRDALLDGETAQRERLRTALGLLAGCLIIAALARLGLFIAMIAVQHPFVGKAYLYLGSAMSIAWIAGAWIVTDERWNARYHELRWLRRAARWTQVLWVPAYFCWLMAFLAFPGTTTGDSWYAASVLLRGTAGIGALLLAYFLMKLAEDSELERPASRINMAIWLLPIPSLLLAMVPTSIPWIFVAVIAMVLLVWCWHVLLWGRAVLEMQRHVSWALKLAADAPLRIVRVTQTRSELDQAVAAQVRPVPRGPAGDVPLGP